jgi:ATP-binding cassette subfamily B protein
MSMQPTESLNQRQAWQNRVEAMKDIPQLWNLLWEAAPIPVASTIALRVIGGLLPLAMLYVAKQLVDLISTGKADGFVVAAWVATEFALAGLGQLIGRAIDYMDSLIADRFSHSLGLKIMHHATSLDLSSFENASFYDKLERARMQCTDRIGMLTAMGWLLQRIVMLVSLASGIIYYSPWLLVVLTISVLPAFLVESHFAFQGYTLSHQLTPTRRALDYYLQLGSSRDSAKEVKIFSLAPHLEKKYRELSQEIITKNQQLALRRLGWGSLFAVIASAGYYGSYAFLAREAWLQHMSLGTFTFMVGAIGGANGHLQMIFSLFSNIADQSLFLRDLVVFLKEKPGVRSPIHAAKVPHPIRKGIEFENVSFQYPGSDRKILDNLSFHMGKGERIALVGENGEGKTTLVKLIARLYDPTEGRILLDGRDIREFNIDELRKEIGVIFQDFVRYDLSARENIGIGNIARVGDDTALWNASKKGNADEVLAKLPGKLDQVLGRRFEGGVDLSGGEWQRMALARAYLRDAQILILDEPTAALDAIAEAEVFQKFAELTKGRMALFISHRFSTVRMADRILVLSGGKIREDGTHDRLVNEGGLYSRLFEVQAACYR